MKLLLDICSWNS